MMSEMAMLRQPTFAARLHFLLMLVTIALVAHLRDRQGAELNDRKRRPTL